MAVNKVPQGTVVSIKVQAGTNKAGVPTFKALRFSGVKPSAADADLYAVASGMGELQKHPIVGIERIDTANLVNA